MAVPIPTTLAHSAPVDPDQEPHSSNTSNVAVVPPMEQCSRESTLTRRSAAYSERRSSTAVYDEQIAERKRLEAEEAERERYEEMEIRRIKEEKARREAEKERKQKEEEQYREQVNSAYYYSVMN
ncbi:unnamed protein product [Cylicostephanus goldi]|uniref:Uncharacterized protein n=1 Tax=Cylicostephanus goldi TaxID=71465 RepID=A0A3P7N359_CYLGO|nr:unnamed protein product [Cylicostephanus goldi]